MDRPTAMGCDASGNLLVLNGFSHNVLKFDGATGAFTSDTFIGGGAFDIIAMPAAGAGADFRPAAGGRCSRVARSLFRSPAPPLTDHMVINSQWPRA